MKNVPLIIFFHICEIICAAETQVPQIVSAPSGLRSLLSEHVCVKTLVHLLAFEGT